VKIYLKSQDMGYTFSRTLPCQGGAAEPTTLTTHQRYNVAGVMDNTVIR